MELQRGINTNACVASHSPGEEHSNTIGQVFQGEDKSLTLIPRDLYCETACILTCSRKKNWEKQNIGLLFAWSKGINSPSCTAASIPSKMSNRFRLTPSLL